MLAGTGELASGRRPPRARARDRRLPRARGGVRARQPGSEPMRVVSVRIPDPVTPAADDRGRRGRAVVRRLADQEAQDATTARTFRIVADPSTGLRSATHFVGYVPTERAPGALPHLRRSHLRARGRGRTAHRRRPDPGRRRLVPRAAGADRALPREHRRGRHAPRRRVPAGRLAGGRVLPGRHPGIPGDAAGHVRMTHVVKDPHRRSSSANEGTHQPRRHGPDRSGRGRLREQQQQQHEQRSCQQQRQFDSGRRQSRSSSKSCTASIAIEAPITGPVAQVGLEQLHFAQLAVADDNAANHTNITLVQDDTQLTPSLAVPKTAVDRRHRTRSRRRPGRQPGGRGRRAALRQGRDGVHLGLGDDAGADDQRQEPDVLPRRPRRRRPGSAGRQLHRQPPAPEGAC